MRKITGLVILGTLSLLLLTLFSFNPPTSAVASIQSIDSSVSQASTGSNHSCALTSTGGVVCWGQNNSAQLGDGTRTSRITPTPVSGLSSGFQAVVSGQTHSCALTDVGAVKCWGFNFYGQLGNGSNSTPNVPVSVLGFSNEVIALAAGANHTCALTNTGAVKCWGLNTSGQLGNADNANSNVPVDVNGLSSGVSAIGAGDYHTCALLSTGGGKCWGSNGAGQLGDNSTDDSNVPVNIDSLAVVLSEVDAGEEHTCVRTSSGGMYCWGRNNNGRLGDGTYDDKLVPVQVTGLASGVTSIDAGRLHSCAVVNGGAKCWGNNSDGQLGDGTTSGKNIPTDVSGLTSGVASVSASRAHTCAVLSSGGLYCWGYNYYGQLGDGTSGIYYSPVTVSGMSSGMSDVAAGNSHTCALTASGGIKCWGGNSKGELGNGTNTANNLPQDVTGLSSGVSEVSPGVNYTCALVSAGVQCWGYNFHGQLGNASNSDSNVPVAVSGLASGILQVGTGRVHSCARTNSGGVKCWGWNDNGQLGNGGNDNSNTPVDVTGLPATVSSVAVGDNHTCVVTTTNAAYCWGDNEFGQLGTGNTDDSNTPVAVSGLGSNVIGITAGADHSCAIMNGGAAKCWGKNYSGQLGVTSGGIQESPVDVTNLNSGVTSLDGGSAHTCAIVSGGAKCWGTNSSGELGIDSVSYTDAPIDVTGLQSGVLSITAGGGHSCALVSPSEVKCWGSSDDGEIGTGIPIKRTTPVMVSGYDGQNRIFVPFLTNQ